MVQLNNISKREELLNLFVKAKMDFTNEISKPVLEIFRDDYTKSIDSLIKSNEYRNWIKLIEDQLPPGFRYNKWYTESLGFKKVSVIFYKSHFPCLFGKVFLYKTFDIVPEEYQYDIHKVLFRNHMKKDFWKLNF